MLATLRTVRAIFHRAKHRADKNAVTGFFTYGSRTQTFQEIADLNPGRHRLQAA